MQLNQFKSEEMYQCLNVDIKIEYYCMCVSGRRVITHLSLPFSFSPSLFLSVCHMKIS